MVTIAWQSDCCTCCNCFSISLWGQKSVHYWQLRNEYELFHERFSSPVLTPQFSRRQVLQAGGIGALMGVPGMVAAGWATKRNWDGGAAKKSVIFLSSCVAGPSHLDTWDLKPNAPDGIRGPYKPISTAVPGMQINEMHTRLASMTQDFSLIRSMTHVGNIRLRCDASLLERSGRFSSGCTLYGVDSLQSAAEPEYDRLLCMSG